MQWSKLRSTSRWLPAYAAQCLRRPHRHRGPFHLVLALADHFEPAIVPGEGRRIAEHGEQERRLEWWCREYPRTVQEWPDSDGRPFRHTYFYPAEQYEKSLIERLAEHCRAGLGEIEIHLHHGVEAPDTPEHTRRLLLKFRDNLFQHGCLSQRDGKGEPLYAFVHGNFALANSANGQNCGVDSEMQILAETGCYADLTLPSAPSISQISKINALYECALPLDRRAPQRRGRDLQRGRTPQIYPLIIQGPLSLAFGWRRARRLGPRIENGALTGLNPPTMDRLRQWRQADITVRGRPEWVFVKLHCHGMDPRDKEALLGLTMRKFLRDLRTEVQDGREYKVHFVTAREMVNIILAACDGREGNPGDYRDYLLKLVQLPGGVRSSTSMQDQTVDRVC